MAKAPSTLSFDQQLAACTTPAERLALYRAASAMTRPATNKGRAKSEIVGKAGADFVSFFSNTAAVYRTERLMQGF